MKKTLVFLLLFAQTWGVFTGDRDGSELVKSPHLFHHYFSNHSGENIFVYLWEHYADGDEASATGEHQRLPFHHHVESSASPQAYLPEASFFVVNPMVSQERLFFAQERYVFRFIKEIINPPRLR